MTRAPSGEYDDDAEADQEPILAEVRRTRQMVAAWFACKVEGHDPDRAEIDNEDRVQCRRCGRWVIHDEDE